MGEIASYRRTRNQGIGADVMPASGCPALPPLELQDYWRAPELLHGTGSKTLRRLLCRALDQLAKVERWPRVRTHGRAIA
jgi:hypothetical protein